MWKRSANKPLKWRRHAVNLRHLPSRRSSLSEPTSDPFIPPSPSLSPPLTWLPSATYGSHCQVLCHIRTTFHSQRLVNSLSVCCPPPPPTVLLATPPPTPPHPRPDALPTSNIVHVLYTLLISISIQ